MIGHCDNCGLEYEDKTQGMFADCRDSNSPWYCFPCFQLRAQQKASTYHSRIVDASPVMQSLLNAIQTADPLDVFNTRDKIDQCISKLCELKAFVVQN